MSICLTHENPTGGHEYNYVTVLHYTWYLDRGQTIDKTMAKPN